MTKCKCPYFDKKVGAYNWKGIRCSSDKWGTMTIGDNFMNREGWTKEYRDNWHKEKCTGNFSECYMYHNHS